MKTVDNNYKLNKPTLTIISVISFIICIMSVIKYLFLYRQNYLFNINNISLISIIAITMFITLYAIYSIICINKKLIFNNRFNILNELVILLFMFIIMNIIFEGNREVYKALFLFAIIRMTIRRGLRAGLFTSVISAIFIILIGFVSVKGYLMTITFKNDIIINIMFVLLSCILGYYVDIDKKYINELNKLVNKDGLTGLYNHRYFYDKLEEIVSISKLKGESIVLLFLDIDDFKYYNDLNGHQTGDYALKTLADILKYSVRQDDIIARYGGEEFAIIMPGIQENEAVLWGEKIRLAVEKTRFPGQENQPKKNFTISIGISQYPQKAKTSIQLVKTADDALYRAKFLYKNKVETYVSILDNIKDKVGSKDKEIITYIKTLISIINAKDKVTYAHIERVVIYARLIGDKLNLKDSDRETLIYGAYMHDIGKINIPKEILIKKMPLTNNEWLELKNHPLLGFYIIKDIEALKNVTDIVLYHHERYDGHGYPYGLKGKNIPYLARILTVIDSFDAMTSHRPYNTCKSYEEGKEELIRCSGSQFDPNITQAFINIIDETLIK